MSHDFDAAQGPEENEAADGRRHELRTLILAAANAARQSRHMEQIARVAGPVGRAVRDRVLTLLSATG